MLTLFKHRRSRVAPIIAVAVCVAIFILCCEALGWIGYSMLSGTPATYASMQRDIAAVAEAESAQQFQQPGNGIRVLHPYLGFVTPPREQQDIDRFADRQELEQYGYDKGSGPLVLQRKEDAFVLGIFGGSVAKMFWEKGGANVLAERLSKDPRFAGKEIVISSGAFYSYRQPQQLLSYSYLLSLGAQYDMVLLIDGFNDVFRPEQENMGGAVSSLYPYGWARYTADLTNDPAFRLLFGKLAVLKERRGALSSTMQSPVLRYSFFAGLVWRAFDRGAQNAVQQAELALQEYRAHALDNYALRGPRVQYADEDAYFRDRANVWAQGSLNMFHLARAHGSAFYHFLQPNQYVPGSKPLDAWEQSILHPERYGEPGIPHAVKAGYPYLQQASEQLVRAGITYADLTQIFADQAQPLYTDHCCHFNEEGNAIMGNAIADVVLAQYPQ